MKFLCAVHPEVAAACAAAVRQLEVLGASVEQVDHVFDSPLHVTTGLTADGLQFVGPMFGDALVLRAARACESVPPIPRPKHRGWPPALGAGSPVPAGV